MAIAQKAIDEKSCVKLNYEIDGEIIIGLLNLWIDIFSKVQIVEIKPIYDFNCINPEWGLSKILLEPY